ncbi:hypothetical protein A6A08_09720 [Nocardiopsis sp. TSRI0078]|uniref:hypothetical protein n=1 Tax=unclassified Nocardiopsis TaxID=2649073 RepID=UPI00095AC232|nr:hypothetical protein [Nocardiopsis sp. TSRI0078]OKI15824.1 hypothetical protein A6A08_09720 [Nocardiopsis sp. TSRI0078]
MTSPHGRPRAVALAVAIATAAVATTAAASAPSDDGRHCISDVGTGQEQCFATFDEAITAAEERTGRTLEEQERALDRNRVSLLAAGSDVIIGTYFEHENYGGASFTLYGDNTCQGGDDTEFWFTFPADWQNMISSAQPWARCALWLHSGPDGTGDRDGPYRENTNYVGDYMNDRTVSTTLG